MKLFVDTADPEEMKNARDIYGATGVTINPSLVKRAIEEARIRSYQETFDAALETFDRNVNLQVVGRSHRSSGRICVPGIIYDAHRLVEMGSDGQVVVKVYGTDLGFQAARHLAASGIPVNITLGFSGHEQAYNAAAVGARYYSMFAGRWKKWEEQQPEGNPQAPYIACAVARDTISQLQSPTQVLVASVRGPDDIDFASSFGFVATAPYSVLVQTGPDKIGICLDRPSLETEDTIEGPRWGLELRPDPDHELLSQGVQRFLEDAEARNYLGYPLP